MSRPRNDFTKSEDEHLIEYIAKVKPEPAGRLGNKIYQMLEENADNKWPWSANHPWQSWRERYRKNQIWFDFHIKRLQKGKKKALKDAAQAQVQEQEDEDGGQQTGPRVTADNPPKQTRPQSTYAHPRQVLRKQLDAPALVWVDPNVETVHESEKPKDPFVHYVPTTEYEPNRPAVTKPSHREEIPDSEDVPPQADQTGPGLPGELLHELFGFSDDEENAAPGAGGLHEPSQQPNSLSKKVTNSPFSLPKSSLSSDHISQYPPRSSEPRQSYPDKPSQQFDPHSKPEANTPFSLPKSSLSSDHISQYPPRSSEPRKSQRPSQKLTPPKSHVDHSTTERTPSSAPSSSSPSMYSPEPSQRPRESATPSPYPSTSPTPEPAPKPKGKKPKPKRKPEPNIFGTPPPTPPPKPKQVTPKREPVIVVEGPFRTTLKRPRVVQDQSDSDEGRQWPPKRSKTSANAGAPLKPVGEPTGKLLPQQPPQIQAVPKTASVVHVSSGHGAQQKAEQPLRQRPRPPPQQVNAIASSSKVKLPDVPAPNAGPSSDQSISEQRQGAVGEADPAPAVLASKTGRESPPRNGGETIAGPNASIRASTGNGHAHDQVQVQSRVKVHDHTTAGSVMITNTKEHNDAKAGRSGGGKLNAVPHAHTRRAKDGQHPEGTVVNGLSSPSGPPMANAVPVTVPVPAILTDRVASSVAAVKGAARPAVSAVLPRTNGAAAHAHVLPTRPAHANDPFTSASVNTTPRPNIPPVAVDKGKERASDHHNADAAQQPKLQGPSVLQGKPARRIDLRESLTKAKRPRTSVSLNSSIVRPTSALSRRDSLLSIRSRTSTTSTSSNSLIRSRLSKGRRSSNSRRSSIPIAQLDPEERPKFAEVASLEMANVLQELADKYGVSAKIAMKTYINTGSLSYTESVLQELYAACANREKEIYSRLPQLLKANRPDEDDEEDEENVIPEGLIPDTRRPSPTRPVLEDDRTPQHQPPRSSKSASKSASPRRRPRPSLLNIKPLTVEDNDRLSDYSPPNTSRAGQFARLEKQGRKEEALEREKRRASGLHAVPSHAPSEAPQSQERRPPPAGYELQRIGDDSPSPHDKRLSSMQMDLDVSREEAEPAPVQNTYTQSSEDDMYAHTDDEFAQQMGAVNDEDQGAEVIPDSSPARAADAPANPPDSNAMDASPPRIMAQPPPRPSRNIHDVIDEIVKANPKLAQRHRALAFNVTEENAARMRQFEAKNDPKVLRYLSIRWAGEFLKETLQIQAAPKSDE